ncbi:MAG: hypothetical protein HY268_12640 [Deltaproteobacteria bacterium]|nr:hypothetical protein [Deltaproteobacteria bacterium]
MAEHMTEYLRNLLLKDITHYIEKYILSSFMLYYAIKNVILIIVEIDFLSHMGNDWGRRSPGAMPEVVSYYLLTRYSLLFMFNAFNGSILLCSTRPQQAPQNWKAIFIPTLSVYSILLYNLTDYMPGWMTVNYTPPRLLFTILASSCLLIVGGQLMSLIAVLYLRHSFAVFIQFRDVVMTGPYRYVRHPIYTGYTLLTIGLLLSNVCVAYALISVMYIGLLAYRAHLEETMLAANDPTYRKNIERTGFLFPKLSGLIAWQTPV